ncbi:MarR family winged helix-turn-helix transcriptional regulator [Streptomyces sp. HUAS MG47]|uniref:MarR family winged helix-turn-helix transcriptional regulator n=1 Tax=Streptomyces solicamelliae TaxID=3231716 RepID=UPI0038780F31
MDEPNRYENLTRQVSAISAVRRGMARSLPADCPPGTAGVIALVQRHGDLRIGRISELMGVDMSVSSRHVAHAVERGWVERLPDPDDRRSRILRLTAEGSDKLAELDRRLTAMLAQKLADWSDDDIEQLTAMLSRFRDAFGDCRAHHA